jgi:3-hydroxybutyryl-CoA dehydrogenase
VKSIGVIGAGTMGNGIAHVASLSGFKVVMIDLNQDCLDRGLSIIKKNMQRQVNKEKISILDMENSLHRISASTDFKMLENVDMVIEAATENPEVKKNIFTSIIDICNENTILATNTSSISIDSLASICKNPDKMIGMHFMNPVPLMSLVEVIIGSETSSSTEKIVLEVAKKMGKVPVVCNDSPGFVANRILIPMINEAIFAYEEGVATVEAIDKIMTLGMNHPMGPLKLADLIGLDVVLYICNILHQDFNDDKYKPSQLLVDMVDRGRLGYKSGQGFYKY